MALSTNGKWTVSNITFSVMLLLLSGIFAWQLDQILKLKSFADRGDRFTAQMALDMERRIMASLPPAWLLKQVAEIEAEDKEMIKRLNRIEVRTIRLEERMGIKQRKMQQD